MQTTHQVSTFKINNIDINMYGTIENPLFDCQIVLIKILGYKKSNQCWFYEQNKTIDKYIRIVIQDSDEQNDTVVKQDPENIRQKQKKYFTEVGLYRCLFTSQKPIAIEFQEQVVQLLKDIRMGNLKLIIDKECETTRLLQQNNQSLLNHIIQIKDLEKQILYLQSKLEQASEEISVYEIEIDGKKYRGTALQLIRRLKQHLQGSCNPGLRTLINDKKQNRSYSVGGDIQMTLLHKQKVTNRDERNYIESEFIKRIPSEQRLNRNIPRVRDASKVSEECKIQLQQVLQTPIQQTNNIVQINMNQQRNSRSQTRQIQITTSDNDDLTTIAEVNDNVENQELRDKLLKIKDFINTNKEYPRQKGVTGEEISLAATVQYLRRGKKGTIHRKGKLIGLKESTIKLVEEIIPDFIWANHKSKYQLTEGVTLVKQRKPQNPEYNRIPDDQFKQQLKEFIEQNPRKIKDIGSGQLETKLYKKIKNLVAQRTKDQLKEYLGQQLHSQLNLLQII